MSPPENSKSRGGTQQAKVISTVSFKLEKGEPQNCLPTAYKRVVIAFPVTVNRHSFVAITCNTLLTLITIHMPMH